MARGRPGLEDDGVIDAAWRAGRYDALIGFSSRRRLRVRGGQSPARPQGADRAARRGGDRPLRRPARRSSLRAATTSWSRATRRSLAPGAQTHVHELGHSLAVRARDVDVYVSFLERSAVRGDEPNAETAAAREEELEALEAMLPRLPAGPLACQARPRPLPRRHLPGVRDARQLPGGGRRAAADGRVRCAVARRAAPARVTVDRARGGGGREGRPGGGRALHHVRGSGCKRLHRRLRPGGGRRALPRRTTTPPRRRRTTRRASTRPFRRPRPRPTARPRRRH